MLYDNQVAALHFYERMSWLILWMLTLVTCENWRVVFFSVFSCPFACRWRHFYSTLPVEYWGGFDRLETPYHQRTSEKKKTYRKPAGKSLFWAEMWGYGNILDLLHLCEISVFVHLFQTGMCKTKNLLFSACHTNKIMQSSRQISGCLLEYG